MFDHYKTELYKALDQQDIKLENVNDIEQQFLQILLLRQIPQIETKTNEPYLTISNLLKTQFQKKKNQIIEILQQEVMDFNSIVEVKINSNAM